MKRTRLRRTSDKRKAENALRWERLEETFGPPDEWRCAIWDSGYLVTPQCQGEIHGHEILSRARGGSIVDMTNVVLACDRHNAWISDNPALAHKLGWARYSWEREACCEPDLGPNGYIHAEDCRRSEGER
jgi:hypothetical protein